MDLDLTCVASLLVLYDEQHHGRAAAQLKLTPSALSKRIQRLERQVGVELVTRGVSGGAEPTPAGHRFRTAAAQLLRDAAAAKRCAVAAPVRADRMLVLGAPEGPQDFLRGMLPGVMTEVRSNWPGTRLIYRPVPFPALSSCLLGGEVDVLWTIAATRHPALTSTPLAATAARIGVMDPRHPWVDTDALDITEFADQPLLYHPSVPDEWMSVFYLGDVRPRTEAQLVRVEATNMPGLAREATRRRTALVALEMYTHLAHPRFHTVRLNGAPPVVLHAGHRRRERRGAVHSLVAALARAHPKTAGGQPLRAAPRRVPKDHDKAHR